MIFILQRIKETYTASLSTLNSDVLAAALDVYSAVKLNRDKVPGLNVVADEMGVFFQKTKKSAPPAPAPVQAPVAL